MALLSTAAMVRLGRVLGKPTLFPMPAFAARTRGEGRAALIIGDRDEAARFIVRGPPADAARGRC